MSRSSVLGSFAGFAQHTQQVAQPLLFFPYMLISLFAVRALPQGLDTRSSCFGRSSRPKGGSIVIQLLFRPHRRRAASVAYVSRATWKLSRRGRFSRPRRSQKGARLAAGRAAAGGTRSSNFREGRSGIRFFGGPQARPRAFHGGAQEDRDSLDRPGSVPDIEPEALPRGRGAILRETRPAHRA